MARSYRSDYPLEFECTFAHIFQREVDAAPSKSCYAGHRGGRTIVSAILSDFPARERKPSGVVVPGKKVTQGHRIPTLIDNILLALLPDSRIAVFPMDSTPVSPISPMVIKSSTRQAEYMERIEHRGWGARQCWSP